MTPGLDPSLTERRPNPPAGWARATLPRPDASVLRFSGWIAGKLSVVSALTMAELPDGSGVGPQWHVSISRRGRARPKALEVRRALRAFGMVGAEEDNHHPGAARHFWLPVDPRHRVDCECKTDEVVVVEPDGYRWTNPHAAEDCRGCDQEKLFPGRLCPIHRGPHVAP